jgi:AcrR family transcriptional regulator
VPPRKYYLGMSTKTRDAVADRIVAAALDLLRREGMLALTQPRVAKAAGVRQSHITYYFPTRRDLVAAIAQAIAERLRAGFETALAADRPTALAARLAGIAKPEQTRLLLSLVLAAEHEPAVRALFRRLTKEIRALIAAAFARHGMAADAEAAALFHALAVGLAVLDLARAEPAARRETRTTTARALRHLAGRRSPRT